MLPESFGGRIIYLLQQYGPSFAKGAGVSMWLALVGTLFGCIIGFLVGIVQTIPVDKNDSTAKKILIKIVKFILACYVEFFRGTPMMAQAMFIYFGSAAVFNINMSMWFAAIFIVSINTGAAKAIGLVIPELNGKLIGSAQRVPTPTGSTTILTAVVEGNVTKEQINAAMKAASNESFGYNEDEIVSSDIVGMRFGSLFDATQTMVLPLENGTTEVQVVSWYDNENSYTSQMVRTIKHFGKLLNA